MIGSSKNNGEMIRENAFEHKKKKPGLNLTPGEALTGLRTTGPWAVTLGTFITWLLMVEELNEMKTGISLS